MEASAINNLCRLYTEREFSLFKRQKTVNLPVGGWSFRRCTEERELFLDSIILRFHQQNTSFRSSSRSNSTCHRAKGKQIVYAGAILGCPGDKIFIW